MYTSLVGSVSLLTFPLLSNQASDRFLIFGSQQECAKLKSQIVQSPDKIKKVRSAHAAVLIMPTDVMRDCSRSNWRTCPGLSLSRETRWLSRNSGCARRGQSLMASIKLKRWAGIDFGDAEFYLSSLVYLNFQDIIKNVTILHELQTQMGKVKASKQAFKESATNIEVQEEQLRTLTNRENVRQQYHATVACWATSLTLARILVDLSKTAFSDKGENEED